MSTAHPVPVFVHAKTETVYYEDVEGFGNAYGVAYLGLWAQETTRGDCCDYTFELMNISV